MVNEQTKLGFSSLNSFFKFRINLNSLKGFKLLPLINIGIHEYPSCSNFG